MGGTGDGGVDVHLHQPPTGPDFEVQVKSRSDRNLNEDDLYKIVTQFEQTANGRATVLVTNTSLSVAARAVALQHRLTVYDCATVSEWISSNRTALTKRPVIKTILGDQAVPQRTPRYKKRIWSADEENAFVEAVRGMGLHRSGDRKRPWAALLETIEANSPGVLRERTPTNLKDKARSMGLLSG